MGAAGGGDAAAAVNVDELQQDVQLAEVRLVTRTMLQELGALVQQQPGEGAIDAISAQEHLSVLQQLC
jgi:hypothetical protein